MPHVLQKCLLSRPHHEDDRSVSLFPWSAFHVQSKGTRCVLAAALSGKGHENINNPKQDRWTRCTSKLEQLIAILFF